MGKLDSNIRRMNLDHFLIPYAKINSKWRKDLNVRQEAIRILEKKAGTNLFDVGLCNFLLNTSPEARETKAKMNYWDLIKIKASAQQRKQSTKLKGNERNGRRYLQMTYQIKGEYPKSIQNLSNSTLKKQIIQ